MGIICCPICCGCWDGGGRRAWPGSTADPVAGEVLGEHSQREVHISRGLCLQPEAVDGLRDHLLVLEGGHASQEERGDLLAHGAAWPPGSAAQLVQPRRRGQHAHAVPDQLVAPKAIDAPDFKLEPRPPVDPFERVVHVDRVRPHGHLLLVWLVALRLPLNRALQHAEIAAALDRELAEEAGEGKAARAAELAEQMQLRRRHPTRPPARSDGW
mmetsp:Transcript_5561/g.13747  ORF Transcript_5561/g.13747 Transcript_5561/m.13747 type:complete len:213 (-) Transcript_5561:42-680(-)